MAAIFGHFLKSWEGKFSLQIEDTLSASIPCFVSSYLFSNATKFGDGKKGNKAGKDVPKTRWSLLKMSDAPRTISKRKGIYSCQRSSGKGMHRRGWILETNAVSARGGRSPLHCGGPGGFVGGHSMVWRLLAWGGKTDSCAWRISCGLGWWQETCSRRRVDCCERGVVNNWQVVCISAVENNPRVTISIKQFGSKQFLLSFWHNCYPYKPVHQTSLCCCVIMQLFSAVAFSAIPFPLATEPYSSSSAPQLHCETWAAPSWVRPRAVCAQNPASDSNQRRTECPGFGCYKNVFIAFTRILHNTQYFTAHYRVFPSSVSFWR